MHVQQNLTTSDKSLVSFQAGDALFIPEGWWHQVDSQDMTIAVNFWWRSAFSKSLQPHMHAYYLRRVMDGLLDLERHRAVQSVRPLPELLELYQKLPGSGNRHDSHTDSSSSPDLSSSSVTTSMSQLTPDAGPSCSADAADSGTAPVEGTVHSEDAATAALADTDVLNPKNRHQAALPCEGPMNTALRYDLQQQQQPQLICVLAGNQAQADASKETLQRCLHCSQAADQAHVLTNRQTRKRKADDPGDSTADDCTATAPCSPSSTAQHSSGASAQRHHETHLEADCDQGWHEAARSRADADKRNQHEAECNPFEVKNKRQTKADICSDDGGDHVEKQPLDTKPGRNSSPEQHQTASSQLHLAAMRLLAGAVNDSIMNGQADFGADAGDLKHVPLCAMVSCFNK